MPSIATVIPSPSGLQSRGTCLSRSRTHDKSVWGFNHRVEGTGTSTTWNCVGELGGLQASLLPSVWVAAKREVFGEAELVELEAKEGNV